MIQRQPRNARTYRMRREEQGARSAPTRPAPREQGLRPHMRWDALVLWAFIWMFGLTCWAAAIFGVLKLLGRWSG